MRLDFSFFWASRLRKCSGAVSILRMRWCVGSEPAVALAWVREETSEGQW